MEKKDYDVLILGAGIAGLSAAIYARRRGLETVVISKDIGGQALMAKEIENYPGVSHSSGINIIMIAADQAQEFGAEIIPDQVLSVKKEEEGRFLVKTSGEEYTSKSVIIAAGKIPRELKVPGESKFKGSGVSYCATCDAPLYRKKNAVVVGNGTFAFDATILLSKYASRVYLVTNRNELSGNDEIIKLIKETENIELVPSTNVKEIKGNSKVNAVVLTSEKRGEFELPVDGVFVEMGYDIYVEPFMDTVKLDGRKQVIINNKCETSTEGIFAAGDVTNTPFKQLVISAAEGAKAALSAYEYIQKLAGKKAVTIDWHK